MNYAIIRNTKYTYDQLNLVYRHNERKNTNYSNTDINTQSHENYAIKKCNMPYTKMLKQIINKYELQGRIKNTSNVACEYIITASPEFFIGKSKDEVKRFFESAYKFVSGYKNLGEENIISAKVHMDESTPHMHLVYIPVVHKIDTKSGKEYSKLCCSDFWKGKNSYKMLQDNYYKYMVRSGFKLDRGDTKDNEHLKISDLKRITTYEMQKYEKEMLELEKEIDTEDKEILKREYKRVIKKYNTLATKYSRIKTISDNALFKAEEVELESKLLKEENKELNKEVSRLKHFIDRAFLCVSVLFDYPIDRFKSIVNRFVKEDNENEPTRRNEFSDEYEQEDDWQRRT